MYRDIEGAVSIYDQGAKAGVDIAGIYLYCKCVLRKRGSVVFSVEVYSHLPGRNHAGGCPCCAVDGADFGVVTYDIHNDADRADGRLEKAFHLLTKIHVPVHEIALMMSITLRFIPILIEELDRIMKAQTARGVDFEAGNVFQKVKRTGRILMPLFASAVGRAGDLALAMEARCYQAGRPRTKMYPLRYARADGVVYVLAIVYLAG